MPLDDLVVRLVSGGEYETQHDFKYAGHVVPKGFRTDFASIPRMFRWLITGHDNTRKPALIHDYLVRYGKDRNEADLVFLRAMKENGVSWTKRHVMFWYVNAYTRLIGG